MVTHDVTTTTVRPAALSHRLSAAAAVLFGTFVMALGTGWDIVWHAVVGRDTFWIPPHLVIYGGTVVTIIALASAWGREISGPRLTGDRGRIRIWP